MRLVVYTSQYNGDERDIGPVLGDIRTVSKQKNRDDEITGVLFYENGHFLQAIEGPAENIEALVERLRRDKRHRQMEVLIDQPIDKRYFSDWNMDSVNLNNTTLFTPEIIRKLCDAYTKNIQMKDASFVALIQDMLNTPGIESVLNQ